MAIAFFSCLVTALFIKFIEIIIRQGNANLDDMWKSNWFWDKSYYIIFTLFTAAIFVILKPTENLKSLSQIEELLDETLQTEMPERVTDEGNSP